MAEWSDNAKSVLDLRYLVKNKKGEVIETPDQMLERVSRCVSEAEKQKDRKYWDDRFLGIMDSHEFLPNSPCLINAGRELGQLSACFVLPVKDEIEHIFEMVKQSAVIHKTGGGTGFNFSALRPSGAPVKSTRGVASGPVSFMKAFDTVTDIIKQGGVRRGANMGILNCLSGDMRVRTLNGKVKIRDLDGKEALVYCFDKDKKKVRLRKAVGFKTGSKKEVWKVKLDTESEIVATPDERFMLVTGEYKMLKDLKFGDRLMAFYKNLSYTCRYQVKTSVTSWQGQHKISYEYISGEEIESVGKEFCIHHKDFNKLNDDPDNVEKLPNSEHAKVTVLHDRSWIEAGNKSKGRKGTSLVEHYKNNDVWNKGLLGEEYRKHYKKGFSNQHVVDSVINHKVVSTEFLGFEDTYDLNVDEFHNFVVEDIFVHNCTHPDIQEFIDCKRDGTGFSNFNISVAISNGFLDLVEQDEYIQLHYWGFPYREKILASDLLDRICENAWLNGEPGVLFLDTINKYNPTPWLGKIYATNPCGEAPLLSWESCNLGSINLSKFNKGRGINYDRLKEVVKVAVRFLDDMIDVNKYPRIQIERKSRLTRKIGLGVMGWADLLGMIDVKYDSSQAFSLAEHVMRFVYETALKTSEEIGREKKYCFRKLKRRNACVTTIAPTGTLSLLANCSSGIEPHFSRNYTKEVVNGTKLTFDIPYKVKTAMEITPENHVRMQAAFQKYTDQAVSKTINLPYESKVSDVKDALLLAYTLGCKGLTVYRQGTRTAPLQELSECDSDKCMI